MITTYINPLGQTKTADLTAEQIEVLKVKEGFKVVELVDPFSDDTPAVSKKLTIHRASDEIGCAACSS